MLNYYLYVKHLYLGAFLASLSLFVHLTAQGQGVEKTKQIEQQLQQKKVAMRDSLSQKADSLRDYLHTKQENMAQPIDSLPKAIISRLVPRVPEYKPVLPAKLPLPQNPLDGLANKDLTGQLKPAPLLEKQAASLPDIKQKVDRSKKRGKAFRQQKDKHLATYRNSRKQVADGKQALDSLNMQEMADSARQVVAEKIESLAEKQIAEQVKDLPQSPMAADPKQDALREYLTSEAKGFFAANTEKLQDAQKQLTSLKQKYSRPARAG